MKLRSDRKMLSTEPKGLVEKKGEKPPTFIMADQIEGRSDEETIAEGDVEVRKLSSRLYADKLTHWPLEDEVDAVGNVRLYQYDDEMRGPHLRMKLTEQIGFFDEVDYKIRREVPVQLYGSTTPIATVSSNVTVTNTPMMITVPESYGLTPALAKRRPTEGYGHAKRIDFEGENQVRLNEATYSMCKPDQPDWYLRAKEMKLDYDREVAEGSHATLYFKDVPIFYTPVGSFALNHSRQSGILPATLSTSTKNGFDVTVPYYWNLAPNYDVTFFPREISKRGVQLGAEARYLDYLYSGTTRLEYMPRDDITKKTRWAYNIVHSHSLGQGLSASLDLNGVSDDFYWTDFSSRLLQTTQTQLPRQATLNYSPPGAWWSATTTWLRYQSLLTTPAGQPYFLEPQVNFSGRLPNLHGADFSLLGQYSKFTHPVLVDGARTLAYPQLSLPIVYPAFSITPKIGVHATHYALEQQTAGLPKSISRIMPTFTLDSTLVMERETKWLGRDHIQTLEPRLYYVYIPYRDQSKIPVFDTALSDFNFAQIFTENRYSGYDRINDANQLTAAVTTRFLDAE
ncbi:MAG: LPS-assembly protein LptD, partial [Betaproteobacteria bacterium]